MGAAIGLPELDESGRIAESAKIRPMKNCGWNMNRNG
jgi:hypothetical protein